MPKKVLGNYGHNRVHSPTSVRRIRLAQRRREALELRLQGKSFRAIADVMGIHFATARDYVCHCLADVAPGETAEAVLQQELLRLEAMQEGIYPKAIAGDYEAIKAMRGIMLLRGRYLGILQDSGARSVSIMGRRVNFNTINVNGRPDAQQTGIKVEFIAPDGAKWANDPYPPSLPAPGMNGPRPMNRAEHTDPAYPHRFDGTYTPPPRPTEPPPPEPASNNRERKEAMAERTAQEGFGEYSDFGSPRGSAFDRVVNPNRLSLKGRFV